MPAWTAYQDQIISSLSDMFFDISKLPIELSQKKKKKLPVASLFFFPHLAWKIIKALKLLLYHFMQKQFLPLLL